MGGVRHHCILPTLKKFVGPALILAVMRDVIEDYFGIDRKWWFVGVVTLIDQCPNLDCLSANNCRNVGDASVAAAIRRMERNPSRFFIYLTGCNIICFFIGKLNALSAHNFYYWINVDGSKSIITWLELYCHKWLMYFP